MSSNANRSAARQQKIQESYARLNDIMIKMSHPEIQKDKSENSEYDILEANRKSELFRLNKLLNGDLYPYIPGTYNVGDKLYVTYTKINTYGKDIEVPSRPILIELVDDYDITEIDGKLNVEELTGPQPVTTSSDLGKALINKAHTKFRFNLPIGYCEVKVERA